MQYVVEIRKTGNPNFPASIGILEKQVYETTQGVVPSGNADVAVLEDPSNLIQGLERIQHPLTVFDGGIAYMIKAETEKEVRRLFQKSITELTD